MPAALYRRVFTRATKILGGEEQLARYLHAGEREVHHWRHGGQPPVEALQLVAELLKQQLLKKYRARRRRL
jgi:hypothetical protein